MDLESAYLLALDKVDIITRELFLAGVTSVSWYLLSRDNLKRPEHELSAVYGACATYLSHRAPTLLSDFNAGFKIAGDLTAVRDDYREAATMLAAAAPSPRTIYALIAYNPAEELAATWRPGLTSMPDLIQELWVPEPVDLVIRTGGAALLSNFLPLQSGYARLWSTEKSFVELNWGDIRQEVLDALGSVQLRGV